MTHKLILSRKVSALVSNVLAQWRKNLQGVDSTPYHLGLISTVTVQSFIVLALMILAIIRGPERPPGPSNSKKSLA